MQLSFARESWPIAGAFTISRGSKTAAEVVVVSITAAGCRGRGECVPYPHYGETVAGVLQALEDRRGVIERGLVPADIPPLALPRAAANALDCALWDLEAKVSGQPAWRLLGLAEPEPVLTAYTLSLDSPGPWPRRRNERPTGRSSSSSSAGPVIRNGCRPSAGPPPTPVSSSTPMRAGRPTASRISSQLCADLGVELVEQPLPAGADEGLRGLARTVALCADKSAHGRRDLEGLCGKYDAVNIKLDKTGGLTEALALKQTALALGLEIMVGCMLATSLAMAPALLVAQRARFVDLDGPLLLSTDREPAIRFEQSLMYPAPGDLWG